MNPENRNAVYVAYLRGFSMQRGQSDSNVSVTANAAFALGTFDSHSLNPPRTRTSVGKAIEEMLK